LNSNSTKKRSPFKSVWWKFKVGSCVRAPWQHQAPSRDLSHVRPIQTAAAQAVHGKGGVRQGLARMLPALHAAMRCLALSTCLGFFVRCVCVIKLNVLPPAPRRRLQRLPRRWNARPGAAASVAAFSRLHESELPAPACVSLACLCMRADFVRSTNRVINTQSTLRVRS